MIKHLWTATKWLSGVIGSIVLAYMAVEAWVINKAGTVVDPVKAEVAVIREYTKTHHERVERELLMIRSSQDELKNILIKR